MIHTISMTIFPVLMIVAGAGDVLSLRIPNWLTGLIALLFFPLAIAAGMPWLTLGLHAATGVALFILGFGLFAAGLFGGGDAKLIAAAGLWFGWPHAVSFLVLTAFAGGALAIAVAFWAALNMGGGQGRILKRLAGLKPDVPYGYALAVGALLAFPQSWWGAGA